VLRDGLSQREAARRFGIDRGTVSKMVGRSAPPGYRQAGAGVRPKLDAHGPRPPPPPSKAAHFRLESAGVVLDVKCADDAPMQACADIALQMLDRAMAPGTAAPRP
jgi:hypothetical protein